MADTATRRAAKLDNRTIALASLPFMGMISFWQVYDGIVPKMLTGTFGLSNSLTGAIMAIDNVFGLFLLPLFGILSDRCASKLGRRTPFILLGSALCAAHRNRKQRGKPAAAYLRHPDHAACHLHVPHHDGGHRG